MRRVASIALVGIAIVLATASFAAARGGAGGRLHDGGGFHSGFHGGRPGFHGHFDSHHFDGHHFDGHHFDGRRFAGRRFDHRFDRRFFVGVAPFYWPYVYDPYAYGSSYGDTYQTPAASYFWYCPSYGAYYPSVQSCPDAWVAVPAQ